MNQLRSKQAQQYSQVGAQTDVSMAGPHRLIQMLLEGALEKIALAKNFMIEGNIAEKGMHISWAISIISGLRGSLDADKGGEIAENLDGLYEFMERHLFEANLKNKTENLDEVSKLLKEIKSAWDAIAEQAQATVSQESQETQGNKPSSLDGGVSA